LCCLFRSKVAPTLYGAHSELRRVWRWLSYGFLWFGDKTLPTFRMCCLLIALMNIISEMTVTYYQASRHIKPGDSRFQEMFAERHAVHNNLVLNYINFVVFVNVYRFIYIYIYIYIYIVKSRDVEYFIRNDKNFEIVDFELLLITFIINLDRCFSTLFFYPRHTLVYQIHMTAQHKMSSQKKFVRTYTWP
jgi:hypothetical protein